MIIDTHAHYDDEAFNPDRDALLNSMAENGIEKVVNVCASISELYRTVELMEKYPFVYGAVGVHPDDASQMTQDTLDEICRLSRMDKMVAIGEIITGTKKSRNMRCRRKCLPHRWILPERKNCRL